MVWKRGTMRVNNPGRQVDEPVSAMVGDHAVVGYIGAGKTECVFRYLSNGRGFPFGASRVVPNGVLTDTWVVDLYSIERIVRNSYDEDCLAANLATIKQDIETALLADPGWPPDLARPDLPATKVIFRDSSAEAT